MLLPQNHVGLPEAHRTHQPWSRAVYRGAVRTASVCKINNNNRAIFFFFTQLISCVPWRAQVAPQSCWDRCRSPWRGRGYGKWQRDLSTWSPRSLWNKKQLNKWLQEIPFAFWLSALPPMVSGLSLRLGFTQTFVCTSSVATLTTAANHLCFFIFEGHSKKFCSGALRLPARPGWFLFSQLLFLPRTEQCKMTTQREQGPRQR